MASNDNGLSIADATPPSSDAHGRAALLLVESLIHGLCENSTLDAHQAIEIAERAVAVQLDRAEAADGPAESMWQSHALLQSIAASFGTDGVGAPIPIS